MSKPTEDPTVTAAGNAAGNAARRTALARVAGLNADLDALPRQGGGYGAAPVSERGNESTEPSIVTWED